MEITRREILSGLGGLFISLALVTPASAKTGGRYQKLEEAVSDLAQENDVIILSDSNHNNSRLRAPLNDPSFLASLKKAGITDVYLELSQDFQPLADALIKGRLNQQDFIESITSTTINEMRKLGERHPDFQPRMAPLSATPESVRSFSNNIVALGKANLRVHMADPQPVAEIVSLLFNSETYPQKSPDFLLRRLKQYDHKIADNIQETRQGKALVVYGSLHSWLNVPGGWFEKPSNIDDALRAKGLKTGTVLLTADSVDVEAGRFHRLQNGFRPERKQGVNGIDIPDYIYNPVRDRLIKMSGDTVLFSIPPRPLSPR